MNHANIMNARSKSRPLTTPAARNNEMSAFAIFALALTFSVLTFSVAGCQRNIVKASPPSVPAPPSEPQTTTAPPSASEPAPPPTPAPQATPTKPKPSTPTATEPEKPAETPRPEAPVISPQLTPQAQAAAEQRTNADIKRAEQNLQIAESKQLDEAQHDLVEKVRDFLAQAHEAIHGEDWVRASNLAEKARVLSDELVKSL
jgi:outer membrane biosynthesis protein TonB